ncbi:MAG TPA: hypothetical protein VK908_05230 [Jiangellales bacterium]|nr:hypothetical protein [Jiangellales bacterium]
MVVLAIVIIALATLFAIGIIISSGDAATLDVFVAEVETTVTGVFLTGLITGLVFLIATVLLLTATRRARDRRREQKVLRERAASSQSVSEERDQLAVEKERLERELRERQQLEGERAELRRELDEREATGTTRPAPGDSAAGRRGDAELRSDGDPTTPGPDQATRS